VTVDLVLFRGLADKFAPVKPESTDRDSLAAMLDIFDAIKDNAWKSMGNCITSDPDAFFPASSQQPNNALALCVDCPVKEECLAAGMQERYGVWGGTTENDRKKMRREMNVATDGRRIEYL
jgi:WhiB family redox-sensing transcriptional regulator